MDDEKIIVLFEDNPSFSHILESFIKLYFKKNKKNLDLHILTFFDPVIFLEKINSQRVASNKSQISLEDIDLILLDHHLEGFYFGDQIYNFFIEKSATLKNAIVGTSLEKQKYNGEKIPSMNKGDLVSILRVLEERFGEIAEISVDNGLALK